VKAAILYGQRDVRIEDRPAPCPGPGEVVIAVEAALTDGTDLKTYRRGYHARMIAPPAAFGHEYAGRITAVGPDVTNWRPGDRVVGANSAPCGACFYCARNQPSLCEDLVFVNGAYAEFLLIPARLVAANLLPIPPGLDNADAAFTEPLACVVKGVRELDAPPGCQVAVVGSGPIGLMAVRLLGRAGARVILVGRRPDQLALGAALGAETTLEAPDPADLPASLRGISGGRGPDRVFEATGVPEVWEAAIESVRPGGIVNLFGGCPAGARVSFDAARIHYGEITVRSSFHHSPACIREALALIADRSLEPAAFLDADEPLERLPAVLNEMDRRLRTLKTCIRPGRSTGQAA
jgi:L-iditol 2-dehydrogenase